jgi:hypothetical protein
MWRLLKRWPVLLVAFGALTVAFVCLVAFGVLAVATLFLP